MKKLQFLALILACVLLFPSCVGVGDGALFDNIESSDESSGGAEESNTSADSTAPFALQGETECVIRMYNEDRTSVERFVSINAELQAELRELLEKEAYTTENLTTAPYFHIAVTFTDEVGNEETYYVYSNDTVGYSSSVSPEMTLIAEISDIYPEVGDVLNEAQKEKIEAENKAGFAFDHLTFHADGAYEYDVETFSELGCMGIACAHVFEDGVKLWSINFESQTEEEILAIAETLRTWEGVIDIGFEHITLG